MKMSKEKWILTSVLAFIVIVVTIFVFLFYSNRPKLVLSDMISYFPETIEVQTNEDGEGHYTITELREMEDLFVVLAVGYWKNINDDQLISDLDQCEPSVSFTIGTYQLDMLCVEGDTGYAKVSQGESKLYYKLSGEDYNKTLAYLDNIAK